jgi:hypothetical protein
VAATAMLIFLYRPQAYVDSVMTTQRGWQFRVSHLQFQVLIPRGARNLASPRGKKNQSEIPRFARNDTGLFLFFRFSFSLFQLPFSSFDFRISIFPFPFSSF